MSHTQMTEHENTQYDIQTLVDVTMYMRYAFGMQDTPLSYVTAFMQVAARSPVPMSDLAESLELSRTTITRMVSYLGVGAQEGGQNIVGLQYVHALEDPLDTRRKLVALTQAGAEVARNISLLLKRKTTYAALRDEQLKEAERVAQSDTTSD